jgi:hypothetical protein
MGQLKACCHTVSEVLEDILLSLDVFNTTPEIEEKCSSDHVPGHSS